MDSTADPELGAAQRRFSYDTRRAGLYLLGNVAVPLVALGVIAAVLALLQSRRDEPIGVTMGDALPMGMCLFMTASLGYFFWGVRKLGPHRYEFFTVYERGLVVSLDFGLMSGHPGYPRWAVVPWADVLRIEERRRTSPLARWLLPPTHCHRVTLVLRDGARVTFTGIVTQAAELTSLIRARTGLVAPPTSVR
ncbi:hypothetical protein Cme02nite_34550 [Catellatospora methionotrophica]|uniref:Uncharacterized protein n=1 Tax=Catellatospora methionotrophica TaxID=121620 RepID=A0A8J3PG77_9ACTN|nr:hypothetical protein [Catellatospora methionotrophica]GIG15123.1 hypothetical protein Cme02nite_34550 [Catellatospora methionotrophica]